MSERGFTLIELIIVIAIIGLLAGVAIPSYVNIVVDAHQANMNAIERTMCSVVMLWASNNFVDVGELVYPEADQVTIESMIENGAIDNWTDLGGGTWQYDQTGGTLAYSQSDGGAGYNIALSYYGGSGSGGGE